MHGVVGAGSHGWPMKRGTACLCGWRHEAASSRVDCTGAAAAGARLLDLHRSFSHQASHTRQPPSFHAVATTACVAASRVLPLVAGLHGMTPEMSPSAPPTCLGNVSDLQEIT
jgi:hypothetical protein